MAEIQSALTGFVEDSGESSPVEAKQLMRRMKSGEVLVIDVRPREEYEAGHFPGAVSLPLEELRRKLRSLPKHSEIIAYCRGALLRAL